MSEALHNAHIGARVGDAMAMPVHWYYDTDALDRDYPDLGGYMAPRTHHPDSILWRSRYTPLNKEADILHDQACYWGQRGVHYHQFLQAGENTLNVKLGNELYRFVRERGGYDAEAWLHRYVQCMRTPGWHRDTYVEEYHRGFFERRAQGFPLLHCGIDDRHIGGLATVPALVAALDETQGVDPAVVVEHVALTHRNAEVKTAAHALTAMLLDVAAGSTLRDAIDRHGTSWAPARLLDELSRLPDRVIVGNMLSPACYLPESFTASLALTWKYHDAAREGILANVRCGGDNCHRGVVVGALLAAANVLPPSWSEMQDG